MDKMNKDDLCQLIGGVSPRDCYFSGIGLVLGIGWIATGSSPTGISVFMGSLSIAKECFE